jgi:hypothetical protein
MYRRLQILTMDSNEITNRSGELKHQPTSRALLLYQDGILISHPLLQMNLPRSLLRN